MKLDGNKTYVVALLTIVWGIIGVVLGKIDLNTGIEIILAGLGLVGIRSAIKKIE